MRVLQEVPLKYRPSSIRVIDSMIQLHLRDRLNRPTTYSTSHGSDSVDLLIRLILQMRMLELRVSSP